MAYTVETRPISVGEYQLLRGTTSWAAFTNWEVDNALANDLFNVCITSQDETVGMGRIIGDGVLYFYIQDVIVHPDHQTSGVGSLIMKAIDHYLFQQAPNGAFIGLMSAQGTETFYNKFGFEKRPGDAPGMFRTGKGQK